MSKNSRKSSQMRSQEETGKKPMCAWACELINNLELMELVTAGST
jgi:hypothetical protein